MAAPTPPVTPSGGAARPPGRRTITSRQLMGDERVIIIRHGNDEYRLQITGAGKLILTK